MPQPALGARLRAAVVTVALSAGLLTATGVVTAPPAAASTASAPYGSWNWKVAKVMRLAAMERGKPYRYGAAGPRAFDCSGLVVYVYRHALGRRLPHNAAALYRVSKHIRRTSLRVGDLVFVRWGGAITHVGIYAGNGYWWVAPHTGTRVQRQKMYRASYVYGRVIR